MSSGISVFFIHIVTLVGDLKSNSIPALGARLRRNISPCSICASLSASSMANFCGPPDVWMISSDVAKVSSARAGNAASSRASTRKWRRNGMPVLYARPVSPVNRRDRIGPLRYVVRINFRKPA